MQTHTQGVTAFRENVKFDVLQKCAVKTSTLMRNQIYTFHASDP